MISPELYAHVTAQASVFALVSGVLFALGWHAVGGVLELAGSVLRRRLRARRVREGVPGVAAAL